MATRCCWPPESCAGYLSAWLAMPTRSSSSSARVRAASFFCLRTFTGASMTLSRIVLCENRLNDWNTIPTSARSAASALPSSGSRLPSTSISPESIGSSRFIVRHSVDLPDPEGPITITTWPVGTSRSMSRSTCRSPKCFCTSRMEIIGGREAPSTLFIEVTLSRFGPITRSFCARRAIDRRNLHVEVCRKTVTCPGSVSLVPIRTMLVALLTMLLAVIALPAAGAQPGGYSSEMLYFRVNVGPDDNVPCTIVGELFMPDGASATDRAPAILTTNGFGGSYRDQVPAAQMFASLGYVALAYSGLGFGGSTCKISLDDREYDGKAASQLVSFLGGADGIAFTDPAATPTACGARRRHPRQHRPSRRGERERPAGRDGRRVLRRRHPVRRGGRRPAHRHHHPAHHLERPDVLADPQRHRHRRGRQHRATGGGEDDVHVRAVRLGCAEPRRRGLPHRPVPARRLPELPARHVHRGRAGRPRPAP